MKFYQSMLAGVCVLLCASCSNMDVSNNKRYNFGFKVGYVYKIKADMQISEQGRHLLQIRPIDKASLSDKRYVRGIVSAGSSFEVFQLKYNMQEMSGVIHSKAIILDGVFKGEQVYVSFLTENLNLERGRYGYPDTNLAEVVKVVDPLPF
jgi:hypothetical protein